MKILSPNSTFGSQRLFLSFCTLVILFASLLGWNAAQTTKSANSKAGENQPTGSTQGVNQTRLLANNGQTPNSRNEDAAKNTIPQLVSFLQSGGDQKTGRGFSLVAEGYLKDSPTSRVAALDELGRLCKATGSKESLEVARKILAEFGSPDEWAVCLRNVAWSAPSARDYLVDRTKALLTHKEWQQNPSAGWLEAFDVAVHSKATELLPELATMRAADSATLMQASAVALDRLAAAAPIATLAALNAQPTLLTELPMVRADCFAKADLAQPDQVAAVTTYLDREDVGQEEKEKFLESMLTPGVFYSQNLLTASLAATTPQSDAERLNHLGDVFEQWLNSGRFRALNGALAACIEAINRVADQVAQTR